MCGGVGRRGLRVVGRTSWGCIVCPIMSLCPGYQTLQCPPVPTHKRTNLELEKATPSKTQTTPQSQNDPSSQLIRAKTLLRVPVAVLRYPRLSAKYRCLRPVCHRPHLRMGTEAPGLRAQVSCNRQDLVQCSECNLPTQPRP